MTSTMQFKVGLRGKLSVFERAWHDHNVSIRKGTRIINGKRKAPDVNLLEVCYSASVKGWRKAPTGCRYHLEIRGKDPNDCEITSFDLNHTCPLGAATRKRNVKYAKLASMSEAVGNFQTWKKVVGQAKRLKETVLATLGTSIKTGHAHNVIRGLAHMQLEAQIVQYFWLPGLFKLFEQEDPAGTYKYEHAPPSWAPNSGLKQFLRCYFALSCHKHFWNKADMNLVVSDGTFTTSGIFKHTLLLAVTYDANNELVIMAVGVVDVEDANNWTWFNDFLKIDFPGYEIFMTDADKGIRSEAMSQSLSQQDPDDPLSIGAITSRCARHLAKNCGERNQGPTMNPENTNKIIQCGHARSEYQKGVCLAQIEEVCPAYASWVAARSNEFVACDFLNIGICRWGKVTSNAAEQANNSILEFRSSPIVYMIMEIILWMQNKHYERRAKAQIWVDNNQVLSDYARKLDSEVGKEAGRRRVQMLSRRGDTIKANVSTKPGPTPVQDLPVVVDAGTCEVECPCRLYEEEGRPCTHGKAVIISENLDPTYQGWYHH